MKRLIIVVVSLLAISACSNSKKFVGYKNIASEKYTIEQYMDKSLFQHGTYSQIYYASQSLSSDRASKEDANKNVQRRKKEMEVICANYGGKIVDTDYDTLKKIKSSGKIKGCRVNGKDVYAYRISPVYTRDKLRSIAFKGENPYQRFWMNDICVMKLTEKDHQEKIKAEQEALALEKQRQFEKEKAYQKKVAELRRKNCNVEFINKESIRACGGAIQKMYSTKEQCLVELRESVFKTYKCQDKSILEEAKVQHEKMIKKQQVDKLKEKCNNPRFEYLLALRSKVSCNIERNVAIGANRPFNYTKCIRKEVNKGHAECKGLR